MRGFFLSFSFNTEMGTGIQANMNIKLRVWEFSIFGVRKGMFLCSVRRNLLIYTCIKVLAPLKSGIRPSSDRRGSFGRCACCDCCALGPKSGAWLFIPGCNSTNLLHVYPDRGWVDMANADLLVV